VSADQCSNEEAENKEGADGQGEEDLVTGLVCGLGLYVSHGVSCLGGWNADALCGRL
jgi:hypothetical protein